MRTKTARQSDKMLDAAARLFGTQRFHEVRMEDIAAEAEVGKGTLYRYFADKDELYRSLLVRASHQLERQLETSLAHSTGARARLEVFVKTVIEFFDANLNLLDLIQRAEVMQRSASDFPWQKTRDNVIRLVETLLSDGERAGEFRVRDPHMAVLMLLGGVRSVIRFGQTPRPPELAKRIVAGFLHGAAV